MNSKKSLTGLATIKLYKCMQQHVASFVIQTKPQHSPSIIEMQYDVLKFVTL